MGGTQPICDKCSRLYTFPFVLTLIEDEEYGVSLHHRFTDYCAGPNEDGIIVLKADCRQIFYYEDQKYRLVGTGECIVPVNPYMSSTKLTLGECDSNAIFTRNWEHDLFHSVSGMCVAMANDEALHPSIGSIVYLKAVYEMSSCYRGQSTFLP